MAPRPRPRLTTSAGEIGQLQHNEAAYAQRQVNAGGVYEIVGPAGSAVRVGLFASLRVVNTDSTAHFVKFGDASVTAPADLSDGHWIAPESELFIQTGDQGAYVIADSATVGIYKLVDSIVVANRVTDEPQV